MLSGENWIHRDAAETRLIEYVNREPAYYGPRLESFARQGCDPETTSRLRRPLVAYRRWLAVSYVPQGVPFWPLCDCYPQRGSRVASLFGYRFVYYGDVRDTEALKAWRESAATDGYSGSGPHWPAYRRATEKYARQLIASGTPAEEVNALLVRMMNVEIRLHSDCGYSVNPNDAWRGGYLDGLPPARGPFYNDYP